MNDRGIENFTVHHLLNIFCKETLRALCGRSRKSKSRIYTVVICLNLLGKVCVYTCYNCVIIGSNHSSLNCFTVQTVKYTVTLRIKVIIVWQFYKWTKFISFFIHSQLFSMETHLLKDHILLMAKYNEFDFSQNKLSHNCISGDFLMVD